MHKKVLTFPQSLTTIVQLFSESPNGVVVLEGQALRVRWLNQACVDFLKRSVDEVTGRPLSEILPDHDIFPILDRVLLEKKAQRFIQYRVRSVYGGYRWVSGVASPIDDMIVLQLDDVTPVVRALEGGFLGEQVLSQIPFPTVLLSEAGELLRVNPRATTRLGLDVGQIGDELIARMELLDDRGTAAGAKSLILASLHAREIVEMHGSYWDRLLGERRDCLIYGGPVRDMGRIHAFLLTMIDVTELRRAELAKDAFINSAGHELRTPLTAARSNLELALRQGLDDPLAETRIENAIAATRRMERLINDILETERLETGRLELKLERLDIGQTIAGTVARMRTQLGDEDPFVLDIKGPLPVEHDPIRVEQIVENLLANALRFSPPGGRIRVMARADKGCAMVEVADEGEGILPAEMPWVFDRLFRGQNAKGDGLGVGLFIAKQLVELHGGTIGTTSRSPKGTSVFFFIPLATSMFALQSYGRFGRP